jgi:hypothetical protein
MLVLFFFSFSLTIIYINHYTQTHIHYGYIQHPNKNLITTSQINYLIPSIVKLTLNVVYFYR